MPRASNTGPGLRITLHSQSEVKPRSSVKVVYNQINADLDSAIILLDGYKRANKSHLNKSVAQGYKSKSGPNTTGLEHSSYYGSSSSQWLHAHGFYRVHVGIQ